MTRARRSAQRIIQLIAVIPDVGVAEEAIADVLRGLVKETLGYTGLAMIHVLADALEMQAQHCTCGAKLEPERIVKIVTDALTGVLDTTERVPTLG